MSFLLDDITDNNLIIWFDTFYISAVISHYFKYFLPWSYSSETMFSRDSIISNAIMYYDLRIFSDAILKHKHF